jgi:hypothetical protein
MVGVGEVPERCSSGFVKATSLSPVVADPLKVSLAGDSLQARSEFVMCVPLGIDVFVSSGCLDCSGILQLFAVEVLYLLPPSSIYCKSRLTNAAIASAFGRAAYNVRTLLLAIPTKLSGNIYIHRKPASL